MSTPYSDINGTFTQVCHELARDLVYPDFVGVDRSNITYEDTLLSGDEREKLLDGELAVDRLLKISVGYFHKPLEIMVQERFRRPKFARWRDITITEWNNQTNLPSELYKIKAAYFVYGYGNHPITPTDFTEVVIVNVPILIKGLLNKSLKYTTDLNPRSNQTFLCVSFQDLFKFGAIEYHYTKDERLQMKLDLIEMVQTQGG